ncbi:MAG: trypsin-like peptidase domain-containing protein [Pirellulales bacterium]|nr:trypsin-like peptidase domain-containing protein [Pirellulales bacterium]
MVALQACVLALALSGTGETVLLDFYSDSCGPCRQMDPVVQRLAQAGYPVRKVNVERERDLAGRFGVTRIPCFVMVVDGKEVSRMVGAETYDRLQAMCQLGLTRRSKAETTPPQVPAVQQTSATAAAPVAPLPAVQSRPGFLADPPRTAPAQPSMPGWRITPASTTQSEAAGLSDERLIAATVRLRIEDATGHSFGTGTIIDTREGEALILTCGHLFRDSKGEGRIEVDLFGARPAQKVPGRLISYDLDRDVALLSIRTPEPVAGARLAPPSYEVKKGDRVATAGCNNGEEPTIRHSRITSLDKFIGPPNIQVAGMPVQGRSGGGLFSSDGYVIGVCNAADPTDNEGLFAALGSIHALLDEAKLAFIYQPRTDDSQGPVLAAAPPAMPKEMPTPDKLVQLTNASSRSTQAPSLPAPQVNPASPEPPLSPEERAALEEIRRRKAQGCEVVCVIRSLADPQAKSEIIVLDRASPAFLRELAAGGRTQVQQQLTSLNVPQTSPKAAAPATTPDSNWQPNWRGPTIRR